MNDHTVKHLELIQAVISRLAQNSFAYRAWSIAIVSAVLALAADKPSVEYFLIALIPTLAFWGMDAFYLRQESLFRKLYDSARTNQQNEADGSLFSMDTSQHSSDVATWWRTCWSRTIGPYYGLIVVVILAIAAFVHQTE